MTLTQKQMEAELSPEVRQFYYALRKLVQAGNCLVDVDDDCMLLQVSGVELADDNEGRVKGVIFKAKEVLGL